MTFSKSWFSYLTRAFALSLCAALLLNFVSCSDSSTSQEPKVVTSTYTVKHLLQNLADDEYTEDEEAAEQKTGTYGTQTAAVAKTYEGFTAQTFAQKTIQADGQTFVEIKYDRNTYTLSYSSEYGDKPQPRTVKYGYILTAEDLPALSEANYSFNGWLLDGASIEAGYPVKKDITLTALWDEIIATYTVKHLLQNLADNSYTEDEEAAEPKSGKSGTQTAAAAKTYEGFTVKPIEQETIKADGSTVIEIYYDRKTYTVSYSSTYGEPPASKPVKYGYVLETEDIPDLSETNYSFKGWFADGISIAEGYIVKKDITLTAQWRSQTGFILTLMTGTDITITADGNTFTATPSVAGTYTYAWYINEVQQSSTTNTFTLDTTGMAPGYYTLVVTAVSDSIQSTSSYQITILGE